MERNIPREPSFLQMEQPFQLGECDTRDRKWAVITPLSHFVFNSRTERSLILIQNLFCTWITMIMFYKIPTIPLCSATMEWLMIGEGASIVSILVADLLNQPTIQLHMCIMPRGQINNYIIISHKKLGKNSVVFASHLKFDFIRTTLSHHWLVCFSPLWSISLSLSLSIYIYIYINSFSSQICILWYHIYHIYMWWYICILSDMHFQLCSIYNNKLYIFVNIYHVTMWYITYVIGWIYSYREIKVEIGREKRQR